jgi:hypothetical protein
VEQCIDGPDRAIGRMEVVVGRYSMSPRASTRGSLRGRTAPLDRTGSGVCVPETAEISVRGGQVPRRPFLAALSVRNFGYDCWMVQLLIRDVGQSSSREVEIELIKRTNLIPSSIEKEI